MGGEVDLMFGRDMLNVKLLFSNISMSSAKLSVNN